MSSGGDVTQILDDLVDGDESAVKRLLPLVYDELRALAAGIFRMQRAGHTLQPTALVHEAYMKLVRSASGGRNSRQHFFDVAAKAMRQLLADYARRRRAAKRGGAVATITFVDAESPSSKEIDFDLDAFQEALSRLEALDPRQARIVELRFLAGLTIEETAEVVEVSPRTVRHDWRMARAFLQRELRND